MVPRLIRSQHRLQAAALPVLSPTEQPKPAALTVSVPGEHVPIVRKHTRSQHPLQMVALLVLIPTGQLNLAARQIVVARPAPVREAPALTVAAGHVPGPRIALAAPLILAAPSRIALPLMPAAFAEARPVRLALMDVAVLVILVKPRMLAVFAAVLYPHVLLLAHAVAILVSLLLVGPAIPPINAEALQVLAQAPGLPVQQRLALVRLQDNPL